MRDWAGMSNVTVTPNANMQSLLKFRYENFDYNRQYSILYVCFTQFGRDRLSLYLFQCVVFGNSAF